MIRRAATLRPLEQPPAPPKRLTVKEKIQVVHSQVFPPNPTPEPKKAEIKPKKPKKVERKPETPRRSEKVRADIWEKMEELRKLRKL
jgi:hypothetical protein